jgi:hypothetical protein
MLAQKQTRMQGSRIEMPLAIKGSTWLQQLSQGFLCPPVSRRGVSSRWADDC